MNDEAKHDETPPRIAILGAGPIGLESALYARYLGYDVAVFEKGEVAQNVLHWGHIKMFSPFQLNRSPLGLAALQAQDEAYRPPGDEELLTGKQYAERYLVPLAKSDLLSDCIFAGVEVMAVGRDGILKSDMGDVNRAEYGFRLLVRKHGVEEIVESDFVVDTTGVLNTPNYLGHGGIPALGELALRSSIDYRFPDVLGTDRQRFANQRVLVVGSGYSAATSIVALGQLRATAPETTVTWINRRARSKENGPIPRVPNDRLPERDRLAQQANSLVRDPDGGVAHWPQTSVVAVSREESSNKFVVQCGGADGGEHQFDRIIANVGFRPDDSIYAELQVHQCYASQGPMKLAMSLAAEGTIDCLDQESYGRDSLINPEPGFFILGSKSFGRHSNFLLTRGLEQIRDAFTLIAGREDLDLYKTMGHLVA